MQRDALLAAGVDPARCYKDTSYFRRPGLTACFKAIRKGDILVVCTLDCLGRDLRHVVKTVHGLGKLGVGLKVLSGVGEGIDTTANGSPILGIFAALAECERALFVERTMIGLAGARRRGRSIGRPGEMTVAKLEQVMAAMRKPETRVCVLCRTLGISRQTLYRHVAPDGSLRTDGKKLLGS